MSKKRRRQLDLMMTLTESKSDLDVYETTYDFRFVFAVILSSQTTDKAVNKLTPELFRAYPSLEAFATAQWEDIAEKLKTIPFFRNKAKNLVKCANQLLDNHNGTIPDTMSELLKLAGCGRKVSNVILNCVHKKQGVVVDTHCLRVANRLGWTKEKTPAKVEIALGKWIPKKLQAEASNNIVLFGRYHCKAKSPLCGTCVFKDECPSRHLLDKTYKKV